MNSIQTELFSIRDTANIEEDVVYQIVLKHMKGFAEWLDNQPYRSIVDGYWLNEEIPISVENHYTTEWLIEEYIKTL